MTDKLFDDIMDVVGGEQAVTYVCFIQDHSGSMRNILPGSESEVSKAEFQRNNYNEQKAILERESDGMETLVTLVEFDDRIKTRFENVEVNEAIDLGDYWTGGMTALYDAIAKGVQSVRESMDEDARDNKAALVIIQTDGEENCSVEHSGEQGRQSIKRLIEELEATGHWTFVLLGENIDQELVASMSALNTMNMTNDFQSYDQSAKTLNRGIEKYALARKAGSTVVCDMLDDSTTDKKWEADDDS